MDDGGRARIRRYGNTEIDIEADAPDGGFLVLNGVVLLCVILWIYVRRHAAYAPYAPLRETRGHAPVWDAARGFWRNKARADRVVAFIQCLTIPSGVGAGGSG